MQRVEREIKATTICRLNIYNSVSQLLHLISLLFSCLMQIIDRVTALYCYMVLEPTPDSDKFYAEENKSSFFSYCVDLDSPCSRKKNYMAAKKPLIVPAISHLKGNGSVGCSTRSSITVTELLLCLLLKTAPKKPIPFFICQKRCLGTVVLSLKVRYVVLQRKFKSEGKDLHCFLCLNKLINKLSLFL